jgi:RHS repeat-associated protein
MTTANGYTTDMFASSINFRDAKGSWQPIDDTLVAAGVSGYSVKNRANGYTALFPVSLNSPVRLILPSGTIEVTLQSASGTITTASNVATYANALPGATIAYEAQPDSLKETIKLASSAAPATFIYGLTLPSQWTAKANPHGGVDLLDANGGLQASFVAPTMLDASKQSGSVSMTLAAATGQQTMTLTADQKWLQASERKFPVLIDPTIWTNVNYFGGQDCFLSSANPTSSFCSSYQYPDKYDFVGYNGANVNRALYLFPIQSGVDHIVPNANILDAELDLTLAYAAPSAVPVTVYPITQTWSDNGATWNNADSSHAWTTAGGTVGSALSTLNVGPTLGSYAFVGLTQTIQSWVSGSAANNGFLIRVANESQVGTTMEFDNQRFDTANPTDPANPHLRVRWNAWGGLQPFFTYVGTQVDDHMSVSVNVANGQLVVHNHDFGVKGVGLDLAVDRYYNSLSDVRWHMGTGWSLSIGCDVQLRLDGYDGPVFQSPDGYQVLFRNNGSGGYITPPGINADLVKNGDGTFTMTFHGSNLQYRFQAAGCLQSVVDRNQNTIQLIYNGDLQSITDTENRSTTVTYGSSYSSSYVTQISDSAGRTYQYGYDSNGNLASYTDANGKVTNYSYNANSQMSQITDPDGHVINFTYSSTYPQPLSQISRLDPSCPGGSCNTGFAYNSGAGPCTSSGVWMNTVVTDGDNHNTTYCYDSQGRVLEVQDALDHARKVAYNSNNDPTQTTDALGHTTQLSYDSHFNLSRIQFPASAAGQTPAAVTFNYQAPGQTFLPSSSTDALGNCGALTYDPSGNLTYSYAGQAVPCDGHTGGTSTCDAYQGNPSGTCGATSTVSCSGAKNGELCWAQDGNSHRTSFAYDNNGNLITVTPPSPLIATQLTVDSLSRTTSIKDGNGQLTSFSYDALDRVVQILYAGATSCNSGSTCTQFSWDADGNLASRADGTGTTNFTYDHLNRLATKSLPDSTTNCSGQPGITTAYDAADNLTQYCDSGGSTAFGYDAANRNTSVAEPGGSCSGTVSLCTTLAYDNDNRLTTVTFPGGASQTSTYDNAGNLTSVVGRDSGAHVISSFNYAYTQGTQDLDVRASMTENDPLSTLTTSYSYDTLGRLAQASNSQTTLTYGYDGAGNRTSGPGGASTFNSANEITSSPGVSSYAFDSDGNLTSSSAGGSLTYNARNQNTAANWSGFNLTGMNYAGSGQAERSAAGSTNYATGQLGLAISNTSGSATHFIRDATGGLLGERMPDGNHWYYLRDGIGSIIAVINGSGATLGDRYAYDPYGKVSYSSGTVTNPWGYAGGYTDPTGLVKFGNRYYDPSLGRFSQPESNALAPSYTYAGDNPVNFADPSGNYIHGACGTCNYFPPIVVQSLPQLAGRGAGAPVAAASYKNAAGPPGPPPATSSKSSGGSGSIYNPCTDPNGTDCWGIVSGVAGMALCAGMSDGTLTTLCGLNGVLWGSKKVQGVPLPEAVWDWAWNYVDQQQQEMYGVQS